MFECEVIKLSGSVNRSTIGATVYLEGKTAKAEAKAGNVKILCQIKRCNHGPVRRVSFDHMTAPETKGR